MRTKAQIFCLSGHENTVCAVLTQPTVSDSTFPVVQKLVGESKAVRH
jgi:hypothetical protein